MSKEEQTEGLVEAAPTLAPAPTSIATVPEPEEWKHMMTIAETLYKGGMLPKAIKKPEAAVYILVVAREIKIGIGQAFHHLHPIAGTVSPSSELQLALLARGGVKYAWIDDGSKLGPSEGKEAVIQMTRTGFGEVYGRFTVEQAKQIKKVEYDDKGNKQLIPMIDTHSWKNYPSNMLRARAVSDGARQLGPDLIMGLSHTPEELGAEVDAHGTPVSASYTVEPADPAEGEAKQPRTDQDATDDQREALSGLIDWAKDAEILSIDEAESFIVWTQDTQRTSNELGPRIRYLDYRQQLATNIEKELKRAERLEAEGLVEDLQKLNVSAVGVKESELKVEYKRIHEALNTLEKQDKKK